MGLSDHANKRASHLLATDTGFRGMLPPQISVAEIGNAKEAPSLFPSERTQAAAFTLERRYEFAMGRQCARAALAALGFPPTEIPAGRNREPVWPAGVRGSLSHASGAWAAAVALRSDILSLGLDIDTDEALPEETAEEIVRRDERAQPTPIGMPIELWEKIVFSAKESVFKAWFPATGTWLGFPDCRIGVEDSGTITAEVITARPTFWPKETLGSWSVNAGYVRTSVWIPAA